MDTSLTSRKQPHKHHLPSLAGGSDVERLRPVEPGTIDIGPVVALPISQLTGVDSPRLSGMNSDHVRVLASLNTGPIPPIVVHHESMRVLDGAHRLAAARLNGHDSIDARIFRGDAEEAFRLSVRLNLVHGLPLSVSDRRAAAERMLRAEPHMSDRAVAATTGLSPGTVADIRLALGPESEASARVGRDGRSRPLSAAEGRERATLVILENPDASLRQVARAAGISVGTVRDVQARLRAGEDPIPQRQRSTRTAAQLDEDESPVDVNALFNGLSRDPSLRYSEQGRSLLRWLERRMLVRDQWFEIPAYVPPHCAGIVAEIARACASSWSNLADRLDAAQEL